jgi:hypothetical protein
MDVWQLLIFIITNRYRFPISLTFRKEIIKLNTNLFLSLIDNESCESGMTSSSEAYFNLCKENIKDKVDWLYIIFGQNLNNNHRLISIFHILSHFNSRDVNILIIDMVTYGLKYNNVEINDITIRCFENWEYDCLIPILQTIKYKDHWLEEYRINVIKDLQNPID